MNRLATIALAACCLFDIRAVCAEPPAPPPSPPSPPPHKFGWKEDKGGVKDTNVINNPRFSVQRINATSDLRYHMPPVYDQGQLGSCTGNGSAAALDYKHHLVTGKFFTPSRLFIYYGAREIEGTIAQDAGAQIRDVIAVTLKLGSPPESIWPYRPNCFAVKPPPAAYTSGAQFQALHAYKVNNGDGGVQVRQSLSASLPVVFGALVYQAIERLNAKDYRLPLPKSGERSIGGHCMVIVGHNDANAVYVVRNSWGTGWGSAGYCLIPYAYIDNPRITSDLWVIDNAE